jgi:peptide chain release factor 2
VVLIEDTAELQIERPNLVRFEARREQANLPAVTIRELLRATLRHRPDRIIVGEVRGGEAFDLLQALNTGHAGSLSTIHAGIKSATVLFMGEAAFGLLSAEAGVHRLVRISPFDQAARRHTSFASVFVWPELPEDVEVDIDDKDLRVDTFRSSGAGGQHVNVTDSAIRITHIPTGIVVSCQNERSQHKNRASAMKVLKARLYDRKMKEQQAKLEQIGGEKRDIAFGSQIRSYVLQPYQMVKDHRTKLQIGDPDRVLNGDLDPFIKTYLMKKASGTLDSAAAADEE